MVGLYVCTSVIMSASIIALAIVLCFRAADRRADARSQALLARLGVPGIVDHIPRAARVSPGHRGLQRLPVFVPPSVARRVVDVTREPDTPALPNTAEGAIANVEFCADERFDSTGGRWLAHVMSNARSLIPPTVDDTPAPPGQRSPILPPSSTSSGLRRRE